MNCTLPAARSGAAVPLPLYGTCTLGMPVTILNNSPTKCGALPVPGDAKLTFCGFAFASATNSLTDFTGNCALATRNIGNVAESTIGTKSRCGSYGKPE